MDDLPKQSARPTGIRLSGLAARLDVAPRATRDRETFPKGGEILRNGPRPVSASTPFFEPSAVARTLPRRSRVSQPPRSSHALRRAIVAMTLSLAGSAAAAEEVQPAPAASLPVNATAKRVTLSEALAYARAHQPAVRAALARIDERRANADIPRAEWSPRAGLTAQLLEGTANNTTASYLGTSVVDVPRIGGTRSQSSSTAGWKPFASTLAGAGIRQEVFDFGRIAAASAAADAQVVVAQRNAEAARLDIELGVEEAFFAVNAAKAVLQASEEAYQRAKVHRDFAAAGVRSGLHSPIELTRAEADLTRFDTGRLRAVGGLVSAQAVLAAAVGSPELVLDTAEIPVMPADLPALPAALDRAEAKDPALAATLAALRAQEETTRAIGALTRPDLQLSATITGRAGGAPPSSGPSPNGDGYLPNVPNWDAGLVLSWPLYDPNVVARKKASATAERVLRAQSDLAKQQLRAGVQESYDRVEVARRTLPSLQHALEAARANYAQADARFKAGLGTSVELADAETLRTDAEIQLALGAFDLARARAAFGRAIAEGL
jgi:outer membrane protein TolC